MRIIAVSHWILKIRRFKNIRRTSVRWIGEYNIRRKAVYFSLVSSLDPSPDLKYKSQFHMKNHHGILFVIDLEAADRSLEFYQTANGNVLCYDTIPSEFFTKIINPNDGSERFAKAEYKEEQPSPKKKSRYDHGQSRNQCQRPTLPCLTSGTRPHYGGCRC